MFKKQTKKTILKNPLVPSMKYQSKTDLKGAAAQLPSPVPAPRSPALARPRLVASIITCPDIIMRSVLSKLPPSVFSWK